MYKRKNSNHPGRSANHRELITHGSLEFPCGRYFTILHIDSHKQYVEWHWHEELEIVCIEKGDLEVHIPGQTIPLKKGDCMLLNANVLHEMTTSYTCELVSLVFHPTLIAGSKDALFYQKYLRPFIKAPNIPFLLWQNHKENTIFIREYFYTAYNHMKNKVGIGFEFFVREYLTKIMIHSLRQVDSSETENSSLKNISSVRIMNMLDYIHTHYATPLTLKMIANVGNVGERECLRCFSRTLQTSPMQYVLRYRVSRGAIMLKENDLSINEIATLCGFDSPSYFSQLFKRYYLCSPREYRERD